MSFVKFLLPQSVANNHHLQPYSFTVLNRLNICVFLICFQIKTPGNMKSSVILLFAVLLWSTCSQRVTEPSHESTIETDLRTYLSETCAQHNIPGLTVAITRNDSLIYSGAFGFESIETKEPLTTKHVFHWASVSKTFVATSVMQLWEQGKINLDEKVTAYLPYFRQNDARYNDITISQMLNHTSGIGDVDDYEWDKPQYDSGALERFVRSIASDKLLFAPGTDMRYSNTAYETLGDVISKISGMSFETYVRKNILDPLGMDTASFLYPDITETLRVRGHVWAGKPIVSEHYPYNRAHGPSSTLNSNVLEMTHYALAHLNRGIYQGRRILSDSIYDIWWKNTINIEDKPSIGFAWWLGERNGVKLVSHSGGDTGFRSIFLLVPERKISIILVSNYELVRTFDLATALLDILMGVKPQPLRRQIGFKFGEVMKSESVTAARRLYETISHDSLQRKLYLWEEDDAALAYPGYLFMENKMFADAIEMFRFNLEKFPNSGWAHAHLATGYANSGDLDSARLNYQKAIKLLPDEKYFREELDKLGK